MHECAGRTRWRDQCCSCRWEQECRWEECNLVGEPEMLLWTDSQAGWEWGWVCEAAEKSPGAVWMRKDKTPVDSGSCFWGTDTCLLGYLIIWWIYMDQDLLCGNSRVPQLELRWVIPGLNNLFPIDFKVMVAAHFMWPETVPIFF